MPYATFADLVAAASVEKLRLYTDNADLGEPDQAFCQLMLDLASADIDGKIGQRYELPLPAPQAAVLKGACVDLAMYRIFGHRDLSPGEVWKDRYGQTMKFLDKVAEGTQTLGQDDPQGTGNRQPVFVDARCPVFTRRGRGGCCAN